MGAGLKQRLRPLEMLSLDEGFAPLRLDKISSTQKARERDERLAETFARVSGRGQASP